MAQVYNIWVQSVGVAISILIIFYQCRTMIEKFACGMSSLILPNSFSKFIRKFDYNMSYFVQPADEQGVLQWYLH